jgi:hypothetical protein
MNKRKSYNSYESEDDDDEDKTSVVFFFDKVSWNVLFYKRSTSIYNNSK